MDNCTFFSKASNFGELQSAARLIARDLVSQVGTTVERGTDEICTTSGLYFFFFVGAVSPLLVYLFWRPIEYFLWRTCMLKRVKLSDEEMRARVAEMMGDPGDGPGEEEAKASRGDSARPPRPTSAKPARRTPRQGASASEPTPKKRARKFKRVDTSHYLWSGGTGGVQPLRTDLVNEEQRRAEAEARAAEISEEARLGGSAKDSAKKIFLGASAWQEKVTRRLLPGLWERIDVDWDDGAPDGPAPGGRRGVPAEGP